MRRCVFKPRGIALAVPALACAVSTFGAAPAVAATPSQASGGVAGQQEATLSCDSAVTDAPPAAKAVVRDVLVQMPDTHAPYQGPCQVSVTVAPVSPAQASAFAGVDSTAGSIACGVVGRPSSSANGNTVWVDGAYSCTAVFSSVAGYVNVSTRSKQFGTSKAGTNGTFHKTFYDVPGSHFSRPVWECPVHFNIIRYGVINVCSSISYI